MGLEMHYMGHSECPGPSAWNPSHVGCISCIPCVTVTCWRSHALHAVNTLGWLKALCMSIPCFLVSLHFKSPESMTQEARAPALRSSKGSAPSSASLPSVFSSLMGNGAVSSWPDRWSHWYLMLVLAVLSAHWHPAASMKFPQSLLLPALPFSSFK